ncbi:MAG: O-methyltransferase [Ignavibacteriales bacterium]
MAGILFPEQSEYLQNIHKTQNDEFDEIRLYAIEHKIPIADEITIRFIEQLLKIKNPQNVLEIGTAIGYSALRMGKIISKKSELTTIEKSTDNIKIARENFQKFGFSNKIKLLHGEAVEILPSLNEQFDFIFLDADKKDYIELFPLLLKLLLPSGLLLVDNLLWKGRIAKSHEIEKENSTLVLRNFNQIFLSEKLLSASILPIGDGLGFGIKK